MFGQDGETLRDAVIAAARALDADGMSRDAAIRALATWTAITNAASAACALVAARVKELGPPASAGASDACDFIAKATGTTAARAKQRANAGERLRGAGATRERAVTGSLSPDQAEAIADAAAADPSAERRLLEVAEQSSLGELRDECARVKAAADTDPDATYRRIHSQRRLRRYRDREGAEHLHAVGTREEMARIDQALKPFADQVFKAARADGVRESYEAYAFDALVALATSRTSAPVGDAGRVKPQYLGIIRVDLDALVRGAVEGEEVCEIGGLGPIPVATARDLLGESVLKLVITRGVDVRNVTHVGRGPNAAQRIALLWERPVCSREGCGRRARLEIDHRDEWQHVLRTELGNLDPFCHHDHRLKTTKGWALVDGQGIRPMVPPDDPRHPRHQRVGAAP